MSSTAPAGSALPRRDRIAILTSLIGITLLCWAYLVWMATDMAAMDLGSIGTGSMGAGSMDSGSLELGSMEPVADMAMTDVLKSPVWTPGYFGMMLSMWVIMMIGMMVPSAAPMALIYAQVARKAARQGTPLAPTFVFVGGYIAMWILFSLGATVAQWGLDRALLLSPMMASTSPALGGALLIAAGLYQMTPMKHACLEHCRAPARFISEHWRPGTTGAFRMGAEHGAYCLGCCWLLMGLLFFGGVMNLLWIAGITLFVLLEKVVPGGAWGGRITGGVLALLGIAVLYTGM